VPVQLVQCFAKPLFPAVYLCSDIEDSSVCMYAKQSSSGAALALL